MEPYEGSTYVPTQQISLSMAGHMSHATGSAVPVSALTALHAQRLKGCFPIMAE